MTGRYCESGEFSGTRTDAFSERADVLEKLGEKLGETIGNSGRRGSV